MGVAADQQSLFGPDPDEPLAKPVGRGPVEMRVLITVKAAPNPSQAYGETVCVAGIRLDTARPAWVRLYPINFRALEDDKQFRKYDVVRLRARPSPTDPRPESFRPEVGSAVSESRLTGWAKRRPLVVDLVNKSMCQIQQEVRDGRPGSVASMAAVRPRKVQGLELQPHPGWSAAEQQKIDAYVQQLALDEDGPRTPLQAPRFKGWYRYLCQSPDCNGHRQGLYDWEFVRLQRRLAGLDDVEAMGQVRAKFLEIMCAPERDTVFYVGNQQKHMGSFIIGGVFYPPL
ncbi:hypothetical protein [Actinomadura hibisca]|uniref:hypothetical protein n=1 Tax=Actinomadura hibisca TaxID=68565 RepID=UPI00082CC113|nr:hypothetical protein [Actinomadura hibisca]